jgi:hypothetical protein
MRERVSHIQIDLLRVVVVDVKEAPAVRAHFVRRAVAVCSIQLSARVNVDRRCVRVPAQYGREIVWGQDDQWQLGSIVHRVCIWTMPTSRVSCVRE